MSPDNNNENAMADTRYASRKFILAAFVLLAALGLLISNVIDPATWASVSTWVLGLYFTGNVGAAFVAKAAKS